MPPNQGVFFVTSTPTGITSETLNTWYAKEHIPDVIASSGFSSAFRFKNITSSTIFSSQVPPQDAGKDEFMCLYPMKDLGFLETEEFSKLPVRSETLGEGKGERLVYDVVKFGVRWYSWIDGFEGEKARSHPSPAKLIITARMSPPKSQEDDFNSWYKNEHYRTLSECKHYIRTRRYRLEKTVSPTGFEAPTFLTIHEFDCEPDELDAEGLGKSGATEWSQKIMGSLEANEVKAWRSIGAWGELKAKF